MDNIFFNISFPQNSGWDYGISTVVKNFIASMNKISNIDRKSKIYMDITLPHIFDYVKGKFNVLYAMYEAEDLPEHYRQKIQEPELVIVPCEHNKKVFQKYRTGPIEVIPLGFNPEIFKFNEKHIKENFIYFYNGATNPRKGFQDVIDAFRILQKKLPNIQLYFKTTGQEKETIFEDNGIVFDSRNITVEEMAELYKQANCFVYPSRGEGYGLGLQESLATGTPSIHTGYSGMEFAKEEYTYRLPYILEDTFIEGHNLHTKWASIKLDDVVEKMEYVYNNYDEAKEKAYKGSIYAKEFTWDNNAKLFKSIMEKKVLKFDSFKDPFSYEGIADSIPEYKILNLGCGNKQLAWVDNLDKNINFLTDILMDLNKEWFIKEETYEEIMAFNIFEYLNDIEHAMRSSYKVLKKNGLLKIRVRLMQNKDIFDDPRLNVLFVPNSFDIFDKSTISGNESNLDFNFKIIHKSIDNDFNMNIVLMKEEK